MQQQAGAFSVEEMITGRIISNSNSDKCKVNVQVNKNHHKVCSLQLRVNNLNIARMKTALEQGVIEPSVSPCL